jgi:alanine-glyoxylate transaminase/serine-glyoxylate transaminase/serine-pyruvate transaminase
MSPGPTMRMPVARGRHFLQLPGPTNVPERVLRAMARGGNDFAAADFVAMTRACLDDLKQVFGTSGEVFAFSANGHGAWELALVNLLDPGDTVLVPGTGRFSASWAEMARRLGFAVEELPPDWRRAADPQAVEDALRADPAGRIKAVLLVHTETATSTRTDLAAMRAAIDAAGHPALLVVDAIASLAIEPFAMDEGRIDVAMTASQKGLMLPAGMAFLAVNHRALELAERCTYPRRYWDLQFRRGAESYMWWHGTPPVQMIWGLREALDMLLEEGLDVVVARHARLAEAVRRCIEAWSAAGALEFNALVPTERANAVTAIRVAQGVDPDRLRKLCQERLDVSLGGGLGALWGKAFRIGHLGDLNVPMVLGALAAIETALRSEGVPHGPGGLEAAVAHLAATMPAGPL